jgi:hypothetical protein
MNEYIKINNQYFHIQDSGTVCVSKGHINRIQGKINYSKGTEVEFINKLEFEDRFSDEILSMIE